MQGFIEVVWVNIEKSAFKIFWSNTIIFSESLIFKPHFVTKSEVPDQTPPKKVAADLGLHCFAISSWDAYGRDKVKFFLVHDTGLFFPLNVYHIWSEWGAENLGICCKLIIAVTNSLLCYWLRWQTTQTGMRWILALKSHLIKVYTVLQNISCTCFLRFSGIKFVSLYVTFSKVWHFVY